MSRDAAEAWEQAHEFERSGDLLLRIGDHAEAARLFRRAGSEEKLLRCLRQVGDHREAALLLEKRGEIEKAVDAFTAAAASSEDARRRLESEVPVAKTRRAAVKAAIRLAALGRDAEAAPLFLRGGEVDAAARRYERAGDRLGVARCHETAGRWLEAARELGLAADPDGDDHRRAAAIQRLLGRHLEEADQHGRGEREVGVLLQEAARLVEQGNLVAALARFRLFRVEQEVAALSRTLGWHEEAIDWLLATDNTAAALRYAREGGFVLSMEALNRLVEGHFDDERQSLEAYQRSRETFVHILAAAAEPLAPEEAAQMTEAFFERNYGQFVSVESIPDRGLALLLRTREAITIMNMLHFELDIRGEPSRQVQEFLEQLARTVEETRDLRLDACLAYSRDMRQFGRPAQAFEKAAALLPLAHGTAAIIGLSGLRYRDAVQMLMEAGSIEEAERYCRQNRDPGLAASWAEKRGDLKEAVRYYREARELDAALRCALGSEDEPTIARVREWRGELPEALLIWKRLGRKADVARVTKKMALPRLPRT